MFFTDTWRPDSFYSRIQANRRQGLHTLCLLDIKVKEPTLESLARGKTVYEPPRFMNVNTAISQLLEVEDKLKVRDVMAPNTLVLRLRRSCTPISCRGPSGLCMDVLPLAWVYVDVPLQARDLEAF